MFKDIDLINVYNDYDYKIYAPSANKNDADYVLNPKISDDEPYYTQMLWRDIKFININSTAIRERKIRFEPSIEDEVYQQLRINIDREKNLYSRQQIEDMIINSNDEIIKEILSITDIGILDKFLSQYVYLENTNKYDLSNKLEMYIRARKEELENGIKKTELEVTPTLNQKVKNVETAVVEESEEDKKEVAGEAEEKVKTTPKRSKAAAKKE